MTKNAQGKEILTMKQTLHCNDDEVVCLFAMTDKISNYGWKTKRLGIVHKGDDGMMKYPICVKISEILEDGWTWNEAKKRCEWEIKYG